jgi:hypothetical protein
MVKALLSFIGAMNSATASSRVAGFAISNDVSERED